MKLRYLAVSLFTFVVFLLLPAESTAQATLFMDDFDSYTAGDYPSSPWWNMFSGVGAMASTEQAQTAPHSFRLESMPNWARWDCVTLALPDHLDIFASVYFTDETRGGAVGIAYVEPGAPNTGWIANAVLFGNDGVIYWVTRTGGSTAIDVWGPNNWRSVYIHVDYEHMTSDVWIDQAVYPGLPADPKILPDTYYGVEVALNNIGVFGNNFSGAGTSVFYVDDFRIEDPGPVPVEETTWGRVKSMFE